MAIQRASMRCNNASTNCTAVNAPLDIAGLQISYSCLFYRKRKRCLRHRCPLTTRCHERSYAELKPALKNAAD